MINYSKMYVRGFISKNDLINAVSLNDLSPADYLKITGDEYVQPIIPSIFEPIKSSISDNEFSINLTGAAVVDRIEGIESDIETIKGGV